jgi:hypothetical protein
MIRCIHAIVKELRTAVKGILRIRGLRDKKYVPLGGIYDMASSPLGLHRQKNLVTRSKGSPRPTLPTGEEWSGEINRL